MTPIAAASASLTMKKSLPVLDLNNASTWVNCHDLSRLPCCMAFPFLMTVGNEIPTGPFQSKESINVFSSLATLSGVAGFGVGTRSRSLKSSPVLLSTMAPFMPVPPMSIPKICIRYIFKDQLCLSVEY